MPPERLGDYLEEPVSSDDLPGLATVRDAVTCEVTAGEYGYDHPQDVFVDQAGAVWEPRLNGIFERDRIDIGDLGEVNTT